MFKHNRSIDSETMKKIEREIVDCIINVSNKNEVMLKLQELKSLSEDDLREKMPWDLIIKKIGLKQIFVSWTNDVFERMKRILSFNQVEDKNDSLEFLEINSEKTYNLTTKYYVKSIFDDINNDIRGILEKYKIKYEHVYPHELFFQKTGHQIDTYSSKETKKWEKKREILDLFQVAVWIISFGSFYMAFHIPVNIWDILAWISIGVSVPTLYKMYRYYVKVRKIRSGYQDRIVIETKNRIMNDLQEEAVASRILEEFYENVVKKLKDRKSKGHHYLKMTARFVSVSLVSVMIFYGFMNKQETSAVKTSEIETENTVNKTIALKEDIEKYLQQNGKITLLSKEPMPEEEIKFVKEDITGEISSVTMNVGLDFASIKVKSLEDKENMKIEASIKPIITVKEWEIKKDSIFKNENKILKEKYKGRIYDEILERYQSKESFISTYKEIKINAEKLAADKIVDLILDEFSETNELDEILFIFNYETMDIDMSSTDLY